MDTFSTMSGDVVSTIWDENVSELLTVLVQFAWLSFTDLSAAESSTQLPLEGEQASEWASRTVASPERSPFSPRQLCIRVFCIHRQDGDWLARMKEEQSVTGRERASCEAIYLFTRAV